MIKQAFQHAELRDANDEIIQQGAYGKKSDLANATNDAWIDHVMNNLEALHDKQEEMTTNLTVQNLTVTGDAIAKTAVEDDNSTKVATTAYADRAAKSAAAGLVDSAPGTLDTLAELAAALGDDPNFATTIATLIDTKCNAAYEKALLNAHPVGSFYESTDPTSPAELFGGTWEEKIPDGELVGSVTAFAGSALPEGWLLCNGTAVNRTDYAALFDVIGTTYGAGDGSTTFSLPNLVDKFIEGSSTAGTIKSAGLPNITGWLTDSYGNMGDILAANGAFYLPSGQNSYRFDRTANGLTASNSVNMDASRSSSIYGNSNTVQPPALTMRFAIYSGLVSKKLWVRTI